MRRVAVQLAILQSRHEAPVELPQRNPSGAPPTSTPSAAARCAGSGVTTVHTQSKESVRAVKPTSCCRL